MAKKKRKPRNRRATQAAPGVNAAPPRADAAIARRERKEQARAAKEAARKRRARTAAVRRAGVFAAVGLVLIGILWFIQRAPGPGKIPEAAAAAATSAGCSGVSHPANNPPGGQHLAAGETITYDQHPATSGKHAPSPLPNSPEIYTEPQDETMAVHFLEHAGVILYYRADGADALPQKVVDALGQVAKDQKMTLLMPYPQLPQGTSLAMTAWNTLQTCPASVTPDQATAIANGFADAFACTSNAKEPNASSNEC